MTTTAASKMAVATLASLPSRHAELLILCARIDFTP